MLSTYHTHIAERSALGLLPLPLSAEQVALLVELLKVTPASSPDAPELVDLLENRIPAGVDQAAYVKAAFLADVANGVTQPWFHRTMQ
jgi:aconitate hydratase 2/2-methylisocitrate dehydratase